MKIAGGVGGEVQYKLLQVVQNIFENINLNFC